MQLVALSVFDLKGEFFFPPFFARNEQEGRRSFMNLCRDKSTNIGLNPDDFNLLSIGSFDDSTGLFSPNANGVALFLCNGSSAITP
nr:MAG: nonstructural protein [Microvirus sp.]